MIANSFFYCTIKYLVSGVESVLNVNPCLVNNLQISTQFSNLLASNTDFSLEILNVNTPPT